ncbi:carbamoyltransferase family protein [Beijerinckia indica]|uniref:Carbamoyltransferase n=1 Tax=Beijerinckia indica subsp. indica (strain ATCC 9039 / DSM 1715 / NCIMB 8712) TaxID=395963 RepID=B2IBA5_BEII9|nr:carbamoyltransferase [Beijerinckia indica]ACB95189.1 Carbamoyltransferase [Beijerinckia indica subsp. indica ATCC 9039]
MIVLGISAFYHDSAAALVRDGAIIAAAQEERFTRKKHDPVFPVHALRYCLDAAGINGSQVDRVVFYEKPFLKFERLLETYLAFAPRGFTSFRKAMPLWIGEKLFQRDMIQRELKAIAPELAAKGKLRFSEHHFSHAASAFYPSPFEDALILTMDGVGEWTTSSAAIGHGTNLEIFKEIHFPHSLGLLYSALTYYTGFKVNSGEYKVMGLAPYGEPTFAKLILDHLIDVKPDGSFRLNLDYFDYCTGLTMTNKRFDALFGGPPRKSEEPLTQHHMDLAASIQAVTEDVVSRLARSLRKETGQNNLCLAGGVALNCVANGKILRENIFDNIFIQPAAGDAGGALGAALAIAHREGGEPRPHQTGKGAGAKRDAMQGAYLGPSYEQDEIERRLKAVGAVFTVAPDEAHLIEETARALAEEQAIGWHQGRMEFGPRSLGNRSILGDPRSPTMQKTLNLKIKYRESFRPFAPSVLRERVADWFELDADSPYMLLVANVREEHRKPMTEAQKALFGIDKLNVPRSDIPAVTHVDDSARIQTVHKDTNPLYHALLSRFSDLTGCPVLVNTSFNVRGEPIVSTPEDAFRCFMGCEIDMLVVGRCILRKVDQDPSLARDYKNAFALD